MSYDTPGGRLFRILPLPAVVRRLHGEEKNFHTSIVSFHSNQCFFSCQFDLKRTIERGPVSFSVRAMCENGSRTSVFHFLLMLPRTIRKKNTH